MEERGIGDLIAVVFRKWRTVLVFALIFAALLGVFQGSRQMKKVAAGNTEEALEEYNSELSEYMSERESLENSIESTLISIEREEQYVSESPLYSLDLNNLYITKIMVEIGDISEEDLTGPYFGDTLSPMDYVLTRIKNQYVSLWNSTDLGAYFESDAGLCDRYIKELVSISVSDGKTLCITARASSEEDSAALAADAWDFLSSVTDKVSEASFEHSIVILYESTRISSDSELILMVQNEDDAIAQLRSNVEESQNELEALTAPSAPTTAARAVKSAVKYAVVGAVLGTLIGAVWVMFLGMTNGLIMNSTEIENTAKLSFLGSAAGKHRGLPAAADAISGERVWKDRRAGAEFIAAKLGEPDKDNKRLILASSLEAPDSDAVAVLTETLVSAGYSVVLCADAQHSADYIRELKNCSQVVLMERPGTSRIGGILDITAAAAAAGRKTAGFATI